MNNNKNKNVLNNKLAKIFGWCLLIFGILVFISSITSYFDWQFRKNNYTKEYVYSDLGTLYYELNGQQKYVEKIYNTYDEVIELNIPDKETVIMYCDKKDKGSCIYFDSTDTVDQNMENPMIGILIALFLVSVAIFIIPKDKFKKVKNKENIQEEGQESYMSRLYLVYVFMFAVGACLLAWQSYNAINYFRLKNNDNITVATIYSEIYSSDGPNDSYKPVSYYYVNNKKYLYINDSYIDGTLQENLGKTFELYYDIDNPSKVSKKENPVDLFFLLMGACFFAFDFPFVFFKKKMGQRMDKALYNEEKKEWRI